MSLIIADRVKETSTTTGTGAFTLAGAVTGFQAFSAVCAIGDTCYYVIQAVDANGIPTGDWECGLGTYSAANTLTRTTVLASSNGNAAASFSAGTKQVFLDLVAAQVAYRLGIIPGTKWNEYDSSGAVFQILGDGKTIICSTTAGINHSTRADTPRSAGKYYFEFKHLRIEGNGCPAIGVGNASAPISNYCGADANGWCIFSNGQSFHSGSLVSRTAYSVNDVVGVAVDFTASTGIIQFLKNGANNGPAYTGLTLSAMYPMVSSSSSNLGYGMGVLCTRAGDCAHSPPSGFSYWDN